MNTLGKIISVCITCILSLLSVFGLSVNLPADEISPFQRVMPRSTILIVIFCVLWAGLYFTDKKSKKGHKIRAGFTAVIYTIFYLLGFFFKTRGTFTKIWKNNDELLNFLLHFSGFLIVSYCFLLGLFLLFEWFSTQKNIQLKFKNHKLFFAITFLILLIAWLPWIANLFPGITTIDSNDHISQVIGTSKLYDHHPVLHTFWFKFLYIISGSTQRALGLYSVIQILFADAVFSYSILYIATRFKNIWTALAAALWYAFYPVFPVYGMTMWKDVPFGILILIITLNLSKITYAEEKEQRNILIRNSLYFLVLSLLRHNGFFIFIPTFLFLLVKCKANRKFYFSFSLLTIVFYILFQTIGLEMLGVKKGRISEGLSIPLQQIARVVSKHREQLSTEELETIADYFSGHDVGDLYKAILSDPVKRNFNEILFREKPIPFLKLWFDLAKKYPLDYVESVLHNTYGYWFPEANQRTFFFGLYSGEKYDLHPAPLFRMKIFDSIQDYLTNMKYYSFPVLACLFSPAIAIWIIIFCFQYCKLKKSAFWLIYIPLFCLWLQMFGAPAFCEFRYVFGLFTSLPLIISICLFSETVNEK
ncbi:MAG: hypothetical protein IJI41_09675 [Anaerolineaceae bacterium]|nr:hypothetical protein [Anaerolineaceae bacterium]